MLPEIQPRVLITRGGFEHAIARLFRAAGFRDHHRQRVREMDAYLAQGAIESVGVRVIEKINIERIGGVVERVRNELWSERRATDADQEHMLEALSFLRCDFPALDIGRELFNARIGLIDIRTQLGSWREFGIAKPVMPDHSALVRICDRACFEFPHGGEGFLHAGMHFLEKTIRKTHSADVDGEVEIVVEQEIFLKSRPKRRRSHVVLLTKRKLLEQDCSLAALILLLDLLMYSRHAPRIRNEEC